MPDLAKDQIRQYEEQGLPVFDGLFTQDEVAVMHQAFARDCESSGLYVHQFKINTTCPSGWEAWAWHQDFVVWQAADNMAPGKGGRGWQYIAMVMPSSASIGCGVVQWTLDIGHLAFLAEERWLPFSKRPHCRRPAVATTRWGHRGTFIERMSAPAMANSMGPMAGV